MIDKRFAAVVGLAAVLCAAGIALGWHGKGHQTATAMALQAAGEAVPEFMRRGVGTICHNSMDPDLCRFANTPALKAGVYAEHFMDIELLAGAPLPTTRYAYLALCAERGIAPESIGFVPYAIAEGTEQLAVALAEYRLWPGSPDIQAKCLVLAGHLAHYAQDLCMPLHVTIHYDGRVGPDGVMVKTGIHQKVDALLGKCPPEKCVTILSGRVEGFADLFPAIVAELKASHALVDRVYELEADLPARDEAIAPDSAVEAFTVERLTASAWFTARLYATAWALSAEISLPPWHLRERCELEALPTPAPMSRPAETQPAAPERE